MAIEQMDEWIKPEKVSSPLLTLPASSYIQREPLGVVLIISPWNYPISLLLNPLVAAIAAGNAAVLKPTEIAVNSGKLLAELIPQYLDAEAFRVIEGGPEETGLLLKQKFDLIFYTGNTAVGKIVMKAAAEHLTPVILELGGKCPVIVCDDADVTVTAQRVAWGKWSLNNGQTCVAPDYVITTPKNEAKFIEELKKTVSSFYGKDPRSSPDVSRMVNERHTERVANLLKDNSIEVCMGGEVDVKSRFIAPTIVKARPQSKVMEGEIFGPVLPVLTVNNLTEAIDYINSGEKPLALYVFSSNSKTQQDVLARTSSGGAAVNDVAMHVGNPDLPFGGVGASGMGSYHGKYGFDAFSHKKAVFVKYGGDPSIRFPPYTASKLKWLKILRSVNPSILKKPAMAILFVGLALAAYRAYGQS